MVNILDRIDKERFDIAYDNHQPSNWIKFAFKYFSNESEKNGFHVKENIAFGLLLLFFIGLIETIFEAPREIIFWTTTTYTVLLSSIVLFLFSAVFANNWRIKQIRKELNITKEEYEILVSAYY